MSRDVVNEVEERRVIRLLADLVAGLPELADDSVYALMATASAPADSPLRPRRCPRSTRFLPAVAAAAAVAIGVALQLDRPASPPSSAVRTGSANLVTFPESTALELLLAPQKDKA